MRRPVTVPARSGPARRCFGRRFRPSGTAHARRVSLMIARPVAAGIGRTAGLHVNRERIYDFYAKEAEAFLKRPRPALLPQFPGLDGGSDGHWGNQDETVWADGRWNATDLGSCSPASFERGDRPERRLRPPRRARRNGRLLQPGRRSVMRPLDRRIRRIFATRHGFMDGLILDGTPLARPAGSKPRASPSSIKAFIDMGSG